MAIDYPNVLKLRKEGRRHTYTDTQTMLYALGIGLGADPLDPNQLAFVYEKNQRAVPTVATVVAPEGGIGLDRIGVNLAMVVHGEEETILHRPMPATATIVTDSSMVEVYDRGPGKGAFLVSTTTMRDADDGQLIATLNRTLVARGDTGFGGPSTGAPPPHEMPNRPPDLTLDVPTSRNQAAIYRLLGDRNPLHIDPDFAKRVGFPAPILHGLCSYGIACRAVMQAYCDHDPTRVYSHAARFSSPVYPGETLTFKFWRDGDIVSFEAVPKGRDAVVLKGGKSMIGRSR